ncbi:unnamed protein product [Amaranthus hypochondriacus]
MQQAEERANIPRPPGRDVEGGGAGAMTPEGKERKVAAPGDSMKKWVFVCRACALVASFLSFILMVFVSDFTQAEGFSYLFSMAVLTTVYMAVQVGFKGHELRTKKDVIPPKVSVWIDYSGDQFLAYMLFSSASVGATTCNFIRSAGLEGPGFGIAAASVSMSFFAFFSLAFTSIFSAYRLFTLLSNS